MMSSGETPCGVAGRRPSWSGGRKAWRRPLQNLVHIHQAATAQAARRPTEATLRPAVGAEISSIWNPELVSTSPLLLSGMLAEGESLLPL